MKEKLKGRFINAYCYCYGATKKRAAAVYKIATLEYIQAVIDCRDHDIRAGFLED